MKGLSANIFIDLVCGQQWINGFSNATFKWVAIHNSSYKKHTKNKSFLENIVDMIFLILRNLL